MMKKNPAGQLTVHALTIALVCAATMIIQIPIPLGYMHLGNCCILLVSLFFGPVSGALAGGIGSALADLLTGYPQWILPTLIIKGIMGFAAGALARDKKGLIRMGSVRTLAGSVTGILIMITGYTLAGSFLYGSLAAGLAQVPGLVLEGILGLILFYAAGFAFVAAGLPAFLKKRA